MPSYFTSTFLQKLESSIIQHVASDTPFKITTFDGKVHELTELEMMELRSFFGIANTALVRQQFESSNTNQMILSQRKQDDKFRREIESVLFKSIYPSSWQVGVLIKTLNMFLGWEDKRQRAMVVPYEHYILRALRSLKERKKKWDEKVWVNKNDEV